MVVVSAGIKPRDDLARDTAIALGERGGIVVDEQVSHLFDPLPVLPFNSHFTYYTYSS